LRQHRERLAYRHEQAGRPGRRTDRVEQPGEHHLDIGKTLARLRQAERYDVQPDAARLLPTRGFREVPTELREFIVGILQLTQPAATSHQ